MVRKNQLADKPLSWVNINRSIIRAEAITVNYYMQTTKYVLKNSP